MTVLAAIDIGSNAMRLAIASVARDGSLSRIDNYREPVRLGKEAFSSGIISEDTLRRAVAAMKKFQQLCKEQGVVLSRCVATSALREARNRQLLIDRVLQESGLHIEIIAGEEEARLVHLAVSHHVDLKNKRAMMIDIGGGSVEITIADDAAVILSDSLKMGTVRLLQIAGNRKVSPRMLSKLIGDYVEGIHRRLDFDFGAEKIELCIGTGGNIETFADIIGTTGKEGKPAKIKVKALEDLIDDLKKISYEERIEKFNLKPDRADVIVPAGIVLLHIAKHAKVDEIVAPRVGLKDGILYDAAPEARETKKDVHRKQVITFAQALGQKYHYDKVHAEKVAALALSIFDQTKSLHGLDAEDRLLLEVAAILHDIGQVIGISGHHKHSLYLIQASPLIGLSERERKIIANVARYHRKAMPSQQHESFWALSEKDRDVVQRLSALLRLAEGLDRQQTGKVQKVRVSCGKSEVSFVLEGEGDLLLERWAMQNKADLFENVFKRKLSIDGVKDE